MVWGVVVRCGGRGARGLRDYALALLLLLVVAPLRREGRLGLRAVRLHQLADLVLLHQRSVEKQHVTTLSNSIVSFPA